MRLRAERLGLAKAPVELAAETSVEDIIATMSQGKAPRLIVIDSIQTMWTDAVESAPGTVTQVRGSAQALIRFAKRSGAAVILVGHVTKDGQIAGPRVVEHMVDAVLSFEGDGAHQFRILRAVKNRFGPTDEIGVFEMTGAGLREVPNPSELFLSERDLGSPGTVVFAGIEGTRPLLVEIQALVAPTSLGTPRRVGGRLGFEPALDGARGAGGALRREARRPRRLSQRRRAACASRNPPPTSPPPRRSSPRSPARRSRPRRSISAKCRSPARSARSRRAAARLKEAAKLGFTRAFAPDAARGEAGARFRPGAQRDRLARPTSWPTSRRTASARKRRCALPDKTDDAADAARYTRGAASLPDSAGVGTVDQRCERASKSSRCRSRCSM